jgi:GT2 family glycosyltransferase
MRADVFWGLGGFPDLAIMEDFEMARRLRRRGNIVIVPEPVVTSARRWLALGVGRTTLINQMVIAAYYLGVPPARIARWYRRKGHHDSHA